MNHTFADVDSYKWNKKKYFSIDELLNNFKEKVLDAVNKAVPTKTINSTKKIQPWIAKEIKAPCACVSVKTFFEKRRTSRMQKENIKHVR